jgi:hypothetical protein
VGSRHHRASARSAHCTRRCCKGRGATLGTQVGGADSGETVMLVVVLLVVVNVVELVVGAG